MGARPLDSIMFGIGAAVNTPGVKYVGIIARLKGGLDVLL